MLPAVAVVVALAWWQWPRLDRLSDQAMSGSVLVLDDGALAAHERAVGDRLREDGRHTEWQAWPSWCESAGLSSTDAEVIVVSLGGAERCVDQVTARLSEFTEEFDRVVVVLRPGLDEPGAPAVIEAARLAVGESVIVVDPSPLIGDGTSTSVPCEWWDDCVGTVVVRVVNGALTDVGAGRIARMIVERLR